MKATYWHHLIDFLLKYLPKINSNYTKLQWFMKPIWGKCQYIIIIQPETNFTMVNSLKFFTFVNYRLFCTNKLGLVFFNFNVLECPLFKSGGWRLSGTANLLSFVKYPSLRLQRNTLWAFTTERWLFQAKRFDDTSNKKLFKFFIDLYLKDFELESDGCERLCIVQETDPDAIKGHQDFITKILF